MFATRRLLVALTIASFVVGWWVAAAVPGPLLAADDLAYFSLARTLAGEGSAPLPAQPPYGLLYPLLLAPGWLLGLGEDAMLHWARAVNALAGALLLPTLYCLVRQLWPRIERGEALAAAAVGSLLPALWLTASIVWTERLLALLVAVGLLALARMRRHATSAEALLAVATAVAMFATHPRMAPPAAVVVLAAAVLLGRSSRVRGVAMAAGAVAAFLLVELARASVAEATFGSSGTYDAADLASRRGVAEVADMAQHGAGALAYLVMAGTGFVVLGVWLLAKDRPLGLAAIAVAVSVLVVAGWFLTGVSRADAWLHGRYIEVVAPVFVSAGVVAAARASRRLLVVAVLIAPIVAGVVGAWTGPGNNWSNARSPVMMLGVEVGGAPFGNDIFEPGAAAFVAIVVGSTAVVARRRAGIAAMVAVLTIAAALGVASGAESLDQLHDNATLGVLDAELDPEFEVDEMFVDTARVSPNLIAAMTWRVGFDRVSAEVRATTTHLLLAPDASAPTEAVLVKELTGGEIWELPK